ncbi:MAG: N-acetylmuramoyl-L-alanine amidase [Prolixibacteraceae bacterium]
MKQTLIILLTTLLLQCGSAIFLTAQGSGFNTKDESQIKMVVIDPGHGGKDYGASWGNLREKDIVLDIALKLGKYITNRFPEIEVIYTRKTDVFIPLHRRAEIANKNDADLFISIHVNYVNSRSVQGTETFVLGPHRSKDNLEVAKKENAVILLENDYTTRYEGFDPNSPESYIMFELVQDEYLGQSVELASAIQKEFRESAKRLDRSVKQAGFLVLRQTSMPGVLVEAGFISHAAERSFMVSEHGKITLATAVFNAFEAYKKKIENKSSFQLIAEKPRVKVKSQTETETVLNPVKPTAPQTAEKEIFFSIQIAALSGKLEMNAQNFQGETNVFELNSGKIYRYFAGRFDNYEKAMQEKQRLKSKFGDAFVVAIENGKLISVKKALRKM